MEKFQIGDVVQLNHGGPKMTIVRNDMPEDQVRCKFFDERNKMHTADLPWKALKKVVDQTK
jgi:uncharacterized protein YodC (DUF2158 family)